MNDGPEQLIILLFVYYITNVRLRYYDHLLNNHTINDKSHSFKSKGNRQVNFIVAHSESRILTRVNLIREVMQVRRKATDRNHNEKDD